MLTNVCVHARCSDAKRREEGGEKTIMFSLKHHRRGSLLWDLVFCYYSFDSETPLLTLTHADTTGDPGIHNGPVYWKG